MFEDLIYSIKVGPGYNPILSYCHVFSSGKVITAEGIYGKKIPETSRVLSVDYIEKIQDIISKYPGLFYINDNALKKEWMSFQTDGVITEVTFSDGEISNTLSVDNLYEYAEFIRKNDDGESTHIYQLLKLVKEIRKVLIEAGINKKYLGL